jgi:hypothetical protein
MDLELLVGEIPLWIVLYYFVMWAINAGGYFVAAFSCAKLAAILPASRLNRGLRRMTFLLLVFGVIRFSSGIDAIIRFYFGMRSTTLTVEFLGVVSLFLNTSFIGCFATVLVLEVRRLRRLDARRRQLIADAVIAFEDLKIAREEIHASTEKSE